MWNDRNILLATGITEILIDDINPNCWTRITRRLLQLDEDGVIKELARNNPWLFSSMKYFFCTFMYVCMYVCDEVQIPGHLREGVKIRSRIEAVDRKPVASNKEISIIRVSLIPSCHVSEIAFTEQLRNFYADLLKFVLVFGRRHKLWNYVNLTEQLRIFLCGYYEINS